MFVKATLEFLAVPRTQIYELFENRFCIPSAVHGQNLCCTFANKYVEVTVTGYHGKR